jgi:asparagine synthase (glutamine-hydrolysing)
MCGIAGYIGSAVIPPQRVRDTLDRMRRRGPDHQGVFSHQDGGTSVLLLHSRLSIIDLDERSNQPFQTGTHHLVYNGELYNYVELKRALQAGGHEFRTTSDTEVLLRVLERRGWRGLKECEGMWALACYDTATGSLLLARDRFGEKPLFLFRDETGLYFGSEVKFLSALLGRKLGVNHRHLYRHLVNGYRSLYKVEETFFEGVEELPAACVLAVGRDGHAARRRYWEPRYEPDERLTFAGAVEAARAALLKSVKLRLRADVPLAFCMSGGVDSNALIAVARKVFGYDVHGFTIANSDARYEEAELVEHAVAGLGLRHTSIPVDVRDFLPRLRTLVRQHDAPVYTITYYAHWLLMESVAAHGYRIAVSGTGADELFTGYYDHHLAYLYEVRGDRPLFESSRRDWAREVRPLVRNPHLGNPALFLEDPAFRDHLYLHADEFARYLRAEWSEPFAEVRYAGDLLHNRMLNELFHEAVPVILHEDDLNAMYFSVENRSPFLDRELFETCYSIPTRHLVRAGRAKAVLREAMRGIVPDRILDNPRKVGFNAPIFSFLDVNDPEVRAQLLDRSPVFEHVRRERIEQLLREESLPNSASKFLFYFLGAKLFLEEFGP